jgi:Na+/melibiose symporter-like transporter
MVTLKETEQTKRKASWLTLIGMGFLTLFLPYVFVWFIQNPEYPKGFRWILTSWAVIWFGSAILFFAVNILGLNPKG